MKKLEEILGYKFNKPALLKQALTHGSYSSKSDENYERLEFLGDRVLGLSVSKILYDTFQSDEEGDLSQRFVSLVCNESVAEVAQNLKLNEFMIVASEEIRTNDTVLGDICEAVIGAIFIDGGFDKAFAFVEKNWKDLLKKNKQTHKDAKTLLQEESHIKALGSPVYKVESREGSEHEPIFTISVSLKDTPPQIGVGKSKKTAEQDAAEKMLNFLGIDYGK